MPKYKIVYNPSIKSEGGLTKKIQKSVEIEADQYYFSTNKFFNFLTFQKWMHLPGQVEQQMTEIYTISDNNVKKIAMVEPELEIIEHTEVLKVYPDNENDDISLHGQIYASPPTNATGHP